MIRSLANLLTVLVFSLSALAQTASISEEEVQARVESISRSLRCVVCQNQSIYESNAPLAIDMRRTVEERIRAGDTDDEVRAYLREPYGDFILLRPPFKPSTLLLWLGPVAFIGLLFFWFARRQPSARPTGPQRITSEQRDKLNEALWGKSGEEAE